MKPCKKKPEYDIKINFDLKIGITYMPLANFVTFMRISS